MPGTLNGQGTFVGEKRLDAEPQERFEKIMIHAWIEDGIKDAVIYKQVGNKKYFVKSLEDETKTAYVGLLKKADCTREGTAYITVTDVEEKEHSVYKLLKNKLIAWVNEEVDDDLDVYTFNYDITTNDEGELVASFKPADEEGVEVKIETVPAADEEENNTPAPVVNEPEPEVQEPVVEQEPQEPETPTEPQEPEVQG